MYYQMAVNRAIAGSDIESPRKRHQFLCQVSSQEPGPAEDSVRSEATLSYTIDATVDTAKLSDAIRYVFIVQNVFRKHNLF